MAKTIKLVEGKTVISVPEQHSQGGPGKIFDTVFFNEQMAFNRDVSVMLLRSLNKELKVADCMSATGARAVRIANEVPNSFVVSNDINPGAIKFIKRNIKLNNLANCKASHKNLQVLLGEEMFDVVDIDPFGSPVPFLHSAIQGCKRNGILAITATDTAPLSGAHADKCKRRYQATPMRGYLCHELGLRILMGYIARELAKFDKGMEPILSYYADHYFRVFVKVTNGANAADNCLSKIVYLKNDPDTLNKTILNTFEKGAAGPIWGGNLFDKNVISNMNSEDIADKKRCEKMLALWNQEIDCVPYLYDLSELSSHLKHPTPKFEKLIEKLSEIGDVSLTHMSPTSFKTTIPLDKIKEVFLSL